MIENMVREGRSIREMARVLTRSPSSILRELRRNKSPVHGSYFDHRAQERANRRRSNASSRMRLKNEEIREYVGSKLKEDWSPEQISGKIGIEQPGLSISHEAILRPSPLGSPSLQMDLQVRRKPDFRFPNPSH